MTEPSGGGRGGERPASPASWERRAAGLATDVQRWLIRTSARSMRDELSGQVKKALRVPGGEHGDPWATATTEPPNAAAEAPECAWCPLCRAARRISQARAEAEHRQAGEARSGSQASAAPGGGARAGGPRLADAADMMAAAAREAVAALDAVLSYRPPAADHPPAADRPPAADHPPADERGEEPQDEPGHRG
jgi:hypothetical protein